MELASMLAGEQFSDRPECVDPVIGAFLRGFNDRLGHHDRQRLLPYAARVVGTRTSRALTRRRIDRCLEYAGVPGRVRGRFRIALLIGIQWALHMRDGAGEFAARVAIARDDVEGGLRLLDELIGSEPATLPHPVVVGPELRVAPARAELELDPR
jgi:hypothetical protein